MSSRPENNYVLDRFCVKHIPGCEARRKEVYFAAADREQRSLVDFDRVERPMIKVLGAKSKRGLVLLLLWS